MVSRRWVWLCVSGLFVACGGDDGGDDASGDTTGATDTAGTTDATGDTGDTGQVTGTDATGDATSKAAPTLTSVVARVAGVRGFDLDLAVVGGDVDRDAALCRVRLFDAAGEPVLAFRTGLSDTPDAHESLVAFSAPITGQASFIGNVRLRGLVGEHPSIAKVEVAVRDAAGQESADVEAEVVAQVVRQLGDACDPDSIEDRCPPGVGCRGTPPQCQEGLAPEVTRLAYLKGEGGTRILAQGTEPEEDLATVLIEFLDNANQPLLVDLDNDEVPESTEFEVDAAGLVIDGAFLVRVNPVPGFEDLVPQVAVTARDAAGHAGARKTARLATTPVRATGQGCDIYGFDVCNTNAVCSPGLPGVTNTCKAKSQLAPAECAAAPVLDPSAGVTTVAGIADGPSIWDAPLTCSSGDPVGRPESVVVLRLQSAAAKVTLTTALPGTNFDTVLYVLPGCGAAGAEPLGCADDAAQGGAAAELVLELVPAGDYLVVVDSWGPDGGNFTLSATVE